MPTSSREDFVNGLLGRLARLKTNIHTYMTFLTEYYFATMCNYLLKHFCEMSAYGYKRTFSLPRKYVCFTPGSGPI